MKPLIINPFYFVSIIALILFVHFFLLNFLNKTNIFLDNNFTKPQSFHSKAIPRFGGVLLFASLSLFFFKDIFYHNQITIYLICVSCFFLGFIDDIKYLENPKLRFFLFFIVIYLISIFFNLKIEDFKIEYINEINQNILLSAFLFVCSIFVATNGANLIDGFNGLLLLNTLLITLAFLIVSYDVNNFFVFEKSLFFLFSILLLFFLNFPAAKIFMGDSGAYLCGAFIAMMSIELNSNSSISPFFLATLNAYFFTEIIFSILRKLYEKKNPFLPDNMHLHMILYKILNKKKSTLVSNFSTSLIINLNFGIIIALSIIFFQNNFISKIIFMSFIIYYVLVYFILRKYESKI